MKKYIAISLGVCLLSGVVAYSLRTMALAKPPLPDSILVLIDTDNGATDALLEGLTQYTQARDCQLRQLNFGTSDTQARLRTLSNSLSNVPRAVVCLGASFEPLLFEAQVLYPDVNFLLIDGEPRRTSDGVYETRTNTHAILFNESQLGFLTGYAAVMDGARSLGFWGASSAQDVIRYGYGFIQGSEAAAAQLGLANGAISLRYRYAGSAPDPIQERTRLATWYAEGVETIFVCDDEQPDLLPLANEAAQEAGGMLLGADFVRTEQVDVLSFCAVKDYGGAAYRALIALEENGGCWDANRAGRTLCEGAAEDAIALQGSANPWPLQDFSPQAYRTLYQDLASDKFPLDLSVSRERVPLAPHCSLRDEGEG